MEYMKNTSYFFIPFKYEKYERFKDLTRMLDESDSWDLVHDEMVGKSSRSRYYCKWLRGTKLKCTCIERLVFDQKAPVSGDRDQLQVSINRNPALLFQYFCMYYGISGTV